MNRQIGNRTSRILQKIDRVSQDYGNIHAQVSGLRDIERTLISENLQDLLHLGVQLLEVSSLTCIDSLERCGGCTSLKFVEKSMETTLY